jgi:hypothetical protein
LVTVKSHIVRERNSSTMRTAHTVVAENMGRDGEKCRKRLIAFGAKRLAILRAAIAHKILFKNMIAVHSPFSRERRSTTGAGGDPFSCGKIGTVLSSPLSALANIVVGCFLKQGIRIHLSCKNQCLGKCLLHATSRKSATLLDDIIRHAIKQVLPIVGTLRAAIKVVHIRLPKRARGSIWSKSPPHNLIHIFEQEPHP